MPFCPTTPAERQELLPTGGQSEQPRTWGRLPRLGLIAILLALSVVAFYVYRYYFDLSPEGAPNFIEVKALAYLAHAIAKEAVIATTKAKSIERQLDEEAEKHVLDDNQWRDVTRHHLRSVMTHIPPPNITRIGTAHGLCACETGMNNITFWPDDDVNLTTTVNVHEIAWVTFGKDVQSINFLCDGMNRSYRSLVVNASANQVISMQLPTGINENFLGFMGFCNLASGLPIVNTWDRTDYISSVVWTSDTEGYACVKIPSLLRTHNGTLLAFAEARTGTCSDFAQTDLIYRRSTDGGQTWSVTKKMVNVDGDPMELGLCGHALVIGNMAPVQLPANSRYPNRILSPYTRNNFEAWIVYSDDDGQTWEGDRRIPNVTHTDGEPDCDRGMSHFGYNVDSLNWTNAHDLVSFVAFLCYGNSDPYHNEGWNSELKGAWQWVGIGPPGSTRLSNGNIIVPSYHSYIRGLEGDGILPVSQLYNNFALGHVMISEDDGDTWHLGEDWDMGQGANENQMHELPNGSLITNMRSLSTGSPQFRLQAMSNDGGVHFNASEFTPIPQPFNGCQGSMVGCGETIFVSSPDPDPASSMLQTVVDMFGCGVQLTGRSRLSFWRSDDAGRTYGSPTLIDHGLAAQTSLQISADQKRLLVLHEQSDEAPLFTAQNIMVDAIVENLKVLLPGRFIFRDLGEIDCS